MIANGTPMFGAGDEFLNTQGGNGTSVAGSEYGLGRGCDLVRNARKSRPVQQPQKTRRISKGCERTLIHAHKLLCVGIKVVSFELVPPDIQAPELCNRS